jgi:chromosomal replication initiation ATPase DnaA
MDLARTCSRKLVETARCRLAEAAIGNAFHINFQDLRQMNRGKRSIAQARQMAIYLAHVALQVDYSGTGRSFGRDRTTTRHACNKIEDLRDLSGPDLILCALQKGLIAQTEQLKALGASI